MRSQGPPSPCSIVLLARFIAGARCASLLRLRYGTGHPRHSHEFQRSLVVCAAALAASMSAGYAGPCSHEIDRVVAEINAKLEAKAAAGPSARESTAATTHRQPTPGSIAAAETRLGDVSSQKVETVAAAMARARKADLAGDQSACEQALADAQRAIGP